ncbi:GNAT family N-acetyltransferase [Vibrio europaeus]|uniref:GNAT family N-acetyltransferase n=1 Tax=Vibrio europaeus TaxID=300876 RepID=UPI00233F306C|nr:GNAT family N-acetyltransferase [Vibrio europaeus]MDC5818887.1 GNAT family N-acetyltransferase [Vibrio europaeus]MDC5871089.1 GNAT family N-acetyltransferase [Vibrio europaeus]
MVAIREMDIADYEEVMALWGQTEGMSIRYADSKESIASYLKRNPKLSFVAEMEGQIVGAVLVGTDGRRGYLQHLAVSPNFRGRQLGRELVDQALHSLANIGIPKTHLFVYNDNVNAQQFYERLGWFARDEVRMYSFNSSSNRNV